MSRLRWTKSQPPTPFPIQYEPSEHEVKILEHFHNRVVSGESVAESGKATVFICFTNRCGSNFLAELLAASGKLPKAREFFNWPSACRFSDLNNATTLEDFCRLLAERKARHGIFASKIGWMQLFFLCRTKMIPRVFGVPKFIHVRRRDLLGQAISYLIAQQTRAWTSRHAAHNEPTYDAEKIAEYMHNMAMGNARFYEFFARFELPAFEVVYEDFLEQPQSCVNSITEWLGLGPSALDPGQIRLNRQQGTLNEEWRGRFLAEQSTYFAAPVETGRA